MMPKFVSTAQARTLAASILPGSYRKIVMLYHVEVRFGNTAQDEVRVSLMLGKHALRFAGGWKS